MPEDFLKRRMQKKNDVQLQHVLQNQDQFSQQEVETAKEILNERKDGSQLATLTENEDKKEPPRSFYEDPINPKYSLRAVATYQLISAVVIIPRFFNISTELTLLQGVLFAFAFLLYVATFISAILIYQKKQMGLFIGLFTNIIQAIQIHVGGIIFYATGFMYTFFAIGSYTGFSFGFLNSTFQISLDAQTNPSYMGVNIIALIALFLVYKASVYWDQNGEFPLHLY